MNPRTITISVIVTTGLVAALGIGFAAGRTTDPDPDKKPAPAAYANAALVRASSCDDLLDSYVARGVERVTAWGWDGMPVYYTTDRDAAPMPESGDAAMPAPQRATSSETGTNVQEAGVDEADVVKTNGEVLVRLDGRDLVVFDVTGDEPTEVGRVRLDPVRTSDAYATELLLVGDRVVVSAPDTEGVTLLTVDIADPTAPEVVDEAEVTGSVQAVRLHGDVVRVVVEQGLPELDFTDPSWWRSENGAKRRNVQVVRDSTITDWVPTLDGEALVDCADVAMPEDDEAPLGTTAVIAFDPTAPTERTTSAVAAEGLASYFSTDRYYLATGDSIGNPMIDCWGPCGREGDGGTTRLYAFELDGTDTTFVAAGEVDGYVRDRWSMDATGDSLRLAVGPSNQTGDFNSVVTLREDGADLVEQGRVDKLGPGEDIKAVRWFDDLAIVVTFRQVDPLYAVDLTDPAAPKLLGELKIPGFSEYLHPLGSQRMIGIGQDADPSSGWQQGAQASLFDVHDLTDPRQLDVVTYRRGTQAGAATDPRQFTWLPDERTALTVITKGWEGRTGWVSVLEVRNGKLHNRMVEVEHGSDVDQVRLVPLPSGKVVLLTEDDVSFFDLG
jgi:hypothetical protein